MDKYGKFLVNHTVNYLVCSCNQFSLMSTVVIIINFTGRTGTTFICISGLASDSISLEAI